MHKLGVHMHANILVVVRAARGRGRAPSGYPGHMSSGAPNVISVKSKDSVGHLLEMHMHLSGSWFGFVGGWSKWSHRGPKWRRVGQLDDLVHTGEEHEASQEHAKTFAEWNDNGAVGDKRMQIVSLSHERHLTTGYNLSRKAFAKVQSPSKFPRPRHRPKWDRRVGSATTMQTHSRNSPSNAVGVGL